MAMLALKDLSVVFISYDEPRGDLFWRDLKRKCPWAKRVHGVTGFDAAHKAAARLSSTEYFITVDGDTIVEPWLFEAAVPRLDDETLIAWRSRNAINGLVYGNGSVKCWPRRVALEMRTHERASDDDRLVDFGLGPARRRFFADAIPATTYSNETPFQAFRAGFREGVRGCLVDGKPAEHPQRDLSPLQIRYLKAWCAIGADVANGSWAILGARLGCIFAMVEVNDVSLISDYGWFLRYWDDRIAPIFRGEDRQCALTGYAWDRKRLSAAVSTAGERLRAQTDLTVVDLSAQQSRLIKRAFAPAPAESGPRYDIQGNLHQRTGTGPAGAEEAAHCYRMGAAVGNTNAMNNLARLNLKTSSGDLGETLELLLNATATGNRFAPKTLATLIGEGEKVLPKQILKDAILCIKDMQIAFLAGGNANSEERWLEISGLFPYATWLDQGATTLPDCPAPAVDHILVVRDQSVIDPRFFDFVIDRGRLDKEHVIAWPARDAITGLLGYDFGPQCWPRALFERQLRSSPDVPIPDNARMASECLAVGASNDSPRQAFDSGFAAGLGLRQALRAGTEAPARSQEWRQRRAAELTFWCSIGADCENGLWSIFGARLACTIDAEAESRDHYWREAARSGDDNDLAAAIDRLGQIIQRTTAIHFMDLNAAASALLKELTHQPFSPECFEQMAEIAKNSGGDAGYRKAAQLYRVAAGIGSGHAMGELAKHYLQGLGVAEDQRRGRYLQTMAAAGAGGATAHLRRG